MTKIEKILENKDDEDFNFPSESLSKNLRLSCESYAKRPRLETGKLFFLQQHYFPIHG
jgi:hypothetical protein